MHETHTPIVTGKMVESEREHSDILLHGRENGVIRWVLDPHIIHNDLAFLARRQYRNNPRVRGAVQQREEEAREEETGVVVHGEIRIEAFGGQRVMFPAQAALGKPEYVDAFVLRDEGVAYARDFGEEGDLGFDERYRRRGVEGLQAGEGGGEFGF